MAVRIIEVRERVMARNDELAAGVRERLRGAGIPAFYTATGYGTIVAEGKTVRDFLRPSDDTKNFNRPSRGPAHSLKDMDKAA